MSISGVKQWEGVDVLDKLTVHDFVHFRHASDDLLHANIEGFSIVVFACIESRDNSVNEGPGILNHINMNKYKSSFRRFRVKAMLESSDETKVVIFETSLWIFETIVEKCVRTSILHERFKTSTNIHQRYDPAQLG
jgi:hypothetical protein